MKATLLKVTLILFLGLAILQGCANHKAVSSLERPVGISPNEVKELIIAINCNMEYNGTIDEGTQVSQAIREKSAEQFLKLGLLNASYFLEAHPDASVWANSWPVPSGIEVKVNLHHSTENPDGTCDVMMDEAHYFIELPIRSDPDQGRSKKEMALIYGSGFQKFGRKWGVRNFTEASSTAIFIKMVEEGKTPYEIIDRKGHYKTSRQIRGMTMSNNIDLGMAILLKAADDFTKKDGIATPWEVGRLTRALPLLDALNKDSPISKRMLELYGIQKPNKAKEIYSHLKKITSMSEKIIIW